MAITKRQMAEARKRTQELRSHVPRAVSAAYDSRQHAVVIQLEHGAFIGFPAHETQDLANAKVKDLSEIEVSPSGYGIYFPRIDVDLYLPSLLEGIFGTKAWMAERSRKGGQATSPAKKAAARANGSLGGRPRKAVVDEAVEEAA